MKTVLEQAPRVGTTETEIHGAEVQHKLTAGEKNLLRRDEKIIQNHFHTFREAGDALVRIRDGRLYRESYATFETYCRGRWAMSKTQANRLIAAAAVVVNLESVAEVRPVLAHLTESAVRPLTGLKPETQRKVVVSAARKAPTAKDITAKFLTQVARELAPKEMPARQTKVPTEVAPRGNGGDLIRKTELLDEISEYVATQKKSGSWSTLTAEAAVRAIRGIINHL